MSAVTVTRLGRLRAAAVRWLPVLRVVGFVGSLAVVGALAVIAVREVPARSLEPGPARPRARRRGGLVRDARAAAGRSSSAAASTREDVSVWCRTQVLRYLPGGIWAPVSRVAAVSGGAADRLVTVAAENVTALCAALAVGGAALAAAGELIWLALVLLAAAPRVAARFTGTRTRVGAQRTVRTTALYMVAFVAYAACAVAVQRAVGPGGEALRDRRRGGRSRGARASS